MLSPPKITEQYFDSKSIEQKHKRRRMTTNLNRWLLVEETRDHIIEGTTKVDSCLCILCANQLSSRMKEQEAELDKDLKLLDTTIVGASQSEGIEEEATEATRNALQKELDDAVSSLESARECFVLTTTIERELLLALHTNT